MVKTLDVYLHDELAGHLIQDEGGQTVFDYAQKWLDRPAATALSVSLPLRKERFRQNECRGFFSGVLPEGNKREIVARNLGISARNDFAMLERIGGECAGAVTFVPTGTPLPMGDYRYRTISTTELANVFKELPKRPLLAGKQGIRLSLAGAQDKIAVRIEGDEISLPLGGAPSTHILKPSIERFVDVVLNEALTMRLAAAVGLPAGNVEVRAAEGIDYLSVQRYDRKHVYSEGGTSLERLHQEDFCQALNVVPEMKYQKEGGPSLKRCFQLLRDVSSTPVLDLARLLDAVIFNYLVGNNDAHGKNFSLLYHQVGTSNQEIRLAPLYDAISTVYYPELSNEMAMKIGGEYHADRVTAGDFDKLAEEAGLAKLLVRRRVLELAHHVLDGLIKPTTSNSPAEDVSAVIRKRCETALSRFRS
jgi:serine/threonine-protein kinase HipA